jgi:mRNA interferase MazF
MAPITSKEFNKDFPTNVFIQKKDSGLNKDSTVLLNQIRTIDKSRLIKNVGSLDNYLMGHVDMALKISLNLN